MIFFTVTAAVNRNSLTGLQREISRVWYWVLLLSTGFGLQSGLFSYIHASMRKKSLTAELAASGTISSGAMLACCAHALVGLLPLLGLSGLAVLLARYQLQLILSGILSNAIGFTVMMGTIKSHNLYTQGGRMERLSSPNWKLIRVFILITGLLLIGMTGLSAAGQSQTGTDSQLLHKANDNYNGVEITVVPRSDSDNQQFEISVSFDTHVADLDFDLTEITQLRDDSGRKYALLSEEGDPPGGHHRSSILVFEAISLPARRVELIFRNINGVDRIYSWELNR
ncbi:hypothetical protein JCM12856_00590 [Spirochaeta dissipatitropha]